MSRKFQYTLSPCKKLEKKAKQAIRKRDLLSDRVVDAVVSNKPTDKIHSRWKKAKVAAEKAKRLATRCAGAPWGRSGVYRD